jgi:hypothetical protein
MFAAHFQKVFGLIFGIDVIFFGLVGIELGGVYSVDGLHFRVKAFLSIVVRIIVATTVYAAEC